MRAFPGLNGLALALSAAAGTPSPPAVVPSDDGLPGVYQTYDSRPLRPGLFLAGWTNRFGPGEGLVRDDVFLRDSSPNPIAVRDPFAYAGLLFLSAGAGAGFDASLALPVYYEYLEGPFSTPDHWAAGDAQAALKFGPPLPIPYVSVSLFARGSAPTSTRRGPALPKRLEYYPIGGSLPDDVSHAAGMTKPRAGLGAGVSLDFGESGEGPGLKLHANGFFDRTLAPDADNPLGLLTASLAAEAQLGGDFRFEGELRHARLASTPSTLGEPIGRSTTLAFGLGGLAGRHFAWRIGAVAAPEPWNPSLPLEIGEPARSGGGRVLRGGFRPQPDWSAFVQIAWEGFPFDHDEDRDGIPSGKDHCPWAPEDLDGFQDEDGCPDPDNDGDGVRDALDRCPYAAEDHDGFEDFDGCPEPDNDRDGVPDSLDRCPNDPEDRDGFHDQDGCPDLDDDRDGIPDALDKCPRLAENRNGIEDSDGCPEDDSDKDGIPDSRDKCPREAEIVNFYQDDDGCPDDKPEPISDAVLAGVRFHAMTAELDPASFMVLDGLAARLFAYPGTEIEIQGHLDDRAGTSARALSLQRAQSVVEYLINRGIEARRLKPAGYGAERPVATNRTAKGREANRRIQIRRLN